MYKKIFVSILAVLVLLFSTSKQVALANTDPLFRVNYGDYKDENIFYHLDYIDPTELEEKSFWDKFKIFSNLSDGVVGFFYNLLHQLFVALPFFMLKAMTTAMIWIFNKIYEVNFVNAIVDEITSSIQSIAGVSGGSFGSSGLFGGFLGLITLVLAVYTLYQVAVKRASITAFSGLLKSILALALALVFFSNYSTIIKGLNTLSVEASALIVSGSAVVTDDGNIVDQTAQEKMNNALWNTFVHQPYLMLQYGTVDQEAIGEERVLNLLQKKPDSEERYNIVKEEILDKGNTMMTREKIFERWGILMITFVANFFNSIPVMILAFALLFLQFWFTAMAMIAPFAFVWSALPNQFGVLARYFLELLTPLVLKLAVSVLALIVFSLTGVLTVVAMNTLNTSGLLSFIFLVFVEGILFFTFFLLRKRILNIFSMGSKQLASVRENMSSAFVQPVKKGVQTTAAAVGTVAGAMSGGAAGALVGSSLGGTIGSVISGDKGITDAGRDVALTYSLYETMQKKKSANANTNTNNVDSGANNIQDSYAKNPELKELSQEMNTNEMPNEPNNQSFNVDTTSQTNQDNLSKLNTRDISTEPNNQSSGKGNSSQFNPDTSQEMKINDIPTYENTQTSTEPENTDYRNLDETDYEFNNGKLNESSFEDTLNNLNELIDEEFEVDNGNTFTNSQNYNDGYGMEKFELDDYIEKNDFEKNQGEKAN